MGMKLVPAVAAAGRNPIRSDRIRRLGGLAGGLPLLGRLARLLTGLSVLVASTLAVVAALTTTATLVIAAALAVVSALATTTTLAVVSPLTTASASTAATTVRRRGRGRR